MGVNKTRGGERIDCNECDAFLRDESSWYESVGLL